MSLEVAVEKCFGDEFGLTASFNHDGEGCLGVLGPSGSGKSLMLKCIAGIEQPDRGRVAVDRRVLFDAQTRISLRPQLRRIGYLFQEYALFPTMTVEENVACGITGGAGEKRAKAADYIRSFHLDGLEKRRPDQLSGGQRQRTALARMLAAEPRAILLDEPFSALDVGLREEMQALLANIVRTRGNAVLVTHSHEEVHRLCSHTLILDRGRIIADGPTRELFTEPGSVRAARLLGFRNISRMRKTGPDTLYAEDWDLRLETERPIPDWAGHVGSRDHDFMPADIAVHGGNNRFPMCVLECSPALVGMEIAMKLAATDSGQGKLFWKWNGTDLPRQVRIPPGALRFLADDEQTQ